MADKYIETIDVGSTFLAHYGVKGMKWDESKKKGSAISELKKELKKQRDTDLDNLEIIRRNRGDADRGFVGNARNKVMDAIIKRGREEQHKEKIKNTQVPAPSPHETGIKKINSAFNKYATNQAHQTAALADDEARKRRIAEDEAVYRKKKQLEEDHKQRLQSDKKLKEAKRKENRSSFENYVDSRLNRRRKDRVRQALSKAAKQTKHR